MPALLQIDGFDKLMGHPKLGDSWEGFIVENILSVTPPGSRAHFYRTSAGAEIDLVLDIEDQRWAIEIKRTSAPKLTRGFHLACDDIAPTHRLVVHAGQEALPMGNDIEALPLQAVMERLRRLNPV